MSDLTDRLGQMVEAAGMVNLLDVAADVYASAKVLAVALATAELRGETDGIDYRVMKGAMGALKAITLRGSTWLETDATAIDVGLERALEVYRRASALEVQRAHQRIEQMERAQ